MWVYIKQNLLTLNNVVDLWIYSYNLNELKNKGDYDKDDCVVFVLYNCRLYIVNVSVEKK